MGMRGNAVPSRLVVLDEVGHAHLEFRVVLRLDDLFRQLAHPVESLPTLEQDPVLVRDDHGPFQIKSTFFIRRSTSNCKQMESKKTNYIYQGIVGMTKAPVTYSPSGIGHQFSAYIVMYMGGFPSVKT